MKKYVFLSLIFLLVISLMIGCAPARRVDPNNEVRDPANNRNNTAEDMIPDNQNNQNNLNNNTVPRDDTTLPRDNNAPGDDEARARRVADIASDIEGVNNATVVVTGDTAYVGIDMKANAKEEETNRLKEKVGDQIKDKEATIDRVLVSADSDTVTRLREIGTDIRNGRPLSGFLEELTEMFRRPTPTVQ